MKRILIRVLAFLALLGGAAAAAAPPIPAGEYVMESGCCTLNVEAMAEGTQYFKIVALGPNGHSCGLDGRLFDRHFEIKNDYDQDTCSIDFDGVDGGFDVKVIRGEDGGTSCRMYCGMRAGFEGTYLKPPAGCTSSEVKAARKKFQASYAKKDFAGARALLEPVLQICPKYIFWTDRGWIRNDLAIAQFRSGDSASCLETLAGFGDDLNQTDKQIRDTNAPSDADNQIRLMKAAKTNLRLCKGETQSAATPAR